VQTLGTVSKIVDGRSTPSLLDFLDRFPRLHTFDRGRPPSTAITGTLRTLRACVTYTYRARYGRSENAAVQYLKLWSAGYALHAAGVLRTPKSARTGCLFEEEAVYMKKRFTCFRNPGQRSSLQGHKVN